MAWRRIVIGVAALAAVLGAVYLTVNWFGDRSKNALMAAAIEAYFRQDSTNYLANGEEPALVDWPICLESKVPFNASAINRDLAHMAFKIHPIEDCIGKISEDETVLSDGFIEDTEYFSPSGAMAKRIVVQKIECNFDHSCSVDIDDFGRGTKFSFKYQWGRWRYVGNENNWIA